MSINWKSDRSMFHFEVRAIHILFKDRFSPLYQKDGFNASILYERAGLATSIIIVILRGGDSPPPYWLECLQAFWGSSKNIPGALNSFDP